MKAPMCMATMKAVYLKSRGLHVRSFRKAPRLGLARTSENITLCTGRMPDHISGGCWAATPGSRHELHSL